MKTTDTILIGCQSCGCAIEVTQEAYQRALERYRESWPEYADSDSKKVFICGRCVRALRHLYRVTAPNFVAGVVARNGQVVHTALILKWALHKPLSRLKEYCALRRWRIERLS
jgi:hypothetical protein